MLDGQFLGTAPHQSFRNGVATRRCRDWLDLRRGRDSVVMRVLSSAPGGEMNSGSAASRQCHQAESSRDEAYGHAVKSARHHHLVGSPSRERGQIAGMTCQSRYANGHLNFKLWHRLEFLGIRLTCLRECMGPGGPLDLQNR